MRPIAGLALTLCLTLTACGGGGGAAGGGADDAPTIEHTITLFPSASRALFGTSQGGAFRVGDTQSDKDVYGLMSFDLSSIPAGATIVHAHINAYVTQREGQPHLLIPTILDHSTWATATIPSVTAYYGGYDNEAFGFLTDPYIPMPGRPHLWEIDVADQLQITLDAPGDFAAFRFRAGAGPLIDGTADAYVVGEPWDHNGLIYPTQLVITYFAP